ncbi:MAG TPA: hypothetical protein VIN73_11830 [Vicingaceae bacterium]
MKELTLLSIILTMSCSCFSQGLTPTVQKLNGDTLFCFTTSQSKVIAGYIEAKIWCDSLMVEQQQWVELLNQTIETNDSLVNGLEQKIKNMQLLYDNRQTGMELLQKTIRIQEKKLKRSNAHKVLLGVGVGIVTGLLIVN